MQRESVLLRWWAWSSPTLASWQRVTGACNVQSLWGLLCERFWPDIRTRSDAKGHHQQRPIHRSCHWWGTFSNLLGWFSGVSLKFLFPNMKILVTFTLSLTIIFTGNIRCVLFFFCLKVWDVVTNQEALEIVSSTLDRGKSAKRLVEYAMRAWKRKRRGIAMDDVSAICLFFHSTTLTHQIHPVSTPV